MKNLLSFLSFGAFLVLIFGSAKLKAQTPQFFKDQATITSGVFLNSTSGKKIQEWYNPSDFSVLPPSGNITHVYFKNEIASASGTYTDFVLSFKQPSSGTGFTGTTFETGFTPVLTSSSMVLTGNATAGGWFSIALTTPFVYDNTKPLVFELQFASYTGGINTWAGNAGTSPTKKLYSSSVTATTGTAHNAYWQDFGIDLQTAPCVAPPTAGNSVTASATACSGAPVQLSLSGNSTGTGQTYVWESSTTLAGTYTPISTSAPTASYTVNPTSTLYYRAAVTCGASTVTSVPVQISVPALFPGGTYTINSGAATGGSNFNNFTDAVNAIKCGISGAVTFNVAAGSGPYNEQITIPHINTTSSTNTITFNGNGRTITANPSVDGERAIIKLDGADWVTINNLVITATGTTTTNYGYGIHMLNDADNNTVNGCTVTVTNALTSANYGGIIVSGSATSATTSPSNCQNITITNNTVSGGNYGIALNGAAATVSNNVISNNVVRDAYTQNIYLNDENGVLVEGNDIANPTRTVPGTFYGVYLTGTVNTRISKNKIHDPLGGIPTDNGTCYGVMLTSSDATAAAPNIVSNNIIYNFVGTGTMYPLANTGSDNARYYHNTVVLDDAAATCACETRGFYQTTSASGIELKNNIFYITRGGSLAKYGVYFNTAATTFTSNNNLFYVSGTGTGTYNVGYKGSASPTLPAWQTAQTQDANSIVANPLFQSATNFTPTNNIDNLGTPVGITTDINNVARNATTPDLGAIEFTVAGCTTPPTPGTATASAALVCPSAPVQLGLTGNTTGAGQTYTWQTSTTLAGTYTNLSTPATVAAYNITPTTTLYYRVAVTCGASTQYSVPVLVTVNNGLTGTFTIDAGAPASATNFQSFGAAVGALSCGIIGPVTFNVIAASGPYNEQVIIPAITGSSATNTVTFNGNGNTLAFAASVSAQRATFKLDGADYVTVNNLVIQATGTTYGYAVQLLNDADFNTINGCTLSTSMTTTSTTSHSTLVVSGSATSPATAGSDCDNVTITNNNISGGYHAIGLVGNGTTTRINNCVVSGNTITDFYTYGIMADGNNNLLIENNDISRPTRASVSSFYGVYFTDVTNSKISKNRVHNAAGGDPASTATCYPIYLTSADATAGNENIISNNLIYNINTASGTVYGFYNVGSDYALYYHNTVVLDFAAATTGATRGLSQTTSATGLEFKNNIVYITRGGGTAKYGVYRATAATTMTANNNVYYINSAGSANNIGYAAGDQGTLSAWQSASGQDANSYTTNPLFTNAATGNFKPTEMTLDGLGGPVGIGTDILNVQRYPNTPDMGAYEFGTPLSVKLLEFTARRTNEDVQTHWTIGSETNIAEYIVERSADGREFTKAGTVSSYGDAVSSMTYKFTDIGAARFAASNVLYYRLRMVEKSGASSFSAIVAVKMDNKGSDIITVVPNPFSDRIKLTAQLQQSGKASIRLVNIVGAVVLQQSVDMNMGSNAVDLNGLSELPAGVYELSIDVNGNRQLFKLVK